MNKNMFSPKKLVKAASIRRKFPSATEKGHFVVYTIDQVRFMMPLSYLQHAVFLELFRMAEEEFGISSEGPITLPCDATSLEYMVLLIKRGAPHDLEIKALIDSFAAPTCFNMAPIQDRVCQKMLLCGC